MNDDMTPAEEQLEDSAEIELRHRLTTLEDWRGRADSALGLLALGGVAMVLAFTALTLLIRKRIPR